MEVAKAFQDTERRNLEALLFFFHFCCRQRCLCHAAENRSENLIGWLRFSNERDAKSVFSCARGFNWMQKVPVSQTTPFSIAGHTKQINTTAADIYVVYIHCVILALIGRSMHVASIYVRLEWSGDWQVLCCVQWAQPSVKKRGDGGGGAYNCLFHSNIKLNETIKHCLCFLHWIDHNEYSIIIQFAPQCLRYL